MHWPSQLLSVFSPKYCIASVLNPLNELLRADKERLWGKRQKEAFQEAK